MSRKAPKTKLGDKLEALALAIADELEKGREVVRDGKPEVLLPPLDERIGGFKALTAYYAMIYKLPPPPDENKGRFGGHKDTISGLGRAGNGALPAKELDF